MADAHEHDEHGHDDHGVPPPEPDLYVTPALFGWGIGTFVFIVVTIIALGGYFWFERGMGTAGERVNSATLLAGGLEKLHATDAERLSTYKKLEGGAVQIPIERAKELLVLEAGAAKKPGAAEK